MNKKKLIGLEVNFEDSLWIKANHVEERLRPGKHHEDGSYSKPCKYLRYSENSTSWYRFHLKDKTRNGEKANE